MSERDRLGPISKARLAAEVTWTYLQVKRALRGVDLPTALARIRDVRGEPRRDAVTTGAGLRLGRAVSGTLRALPTDSRCLMQSLVLTRMLARRGGAGIVVIGVKPGEAFGAHAWVELDHDPLLPTFGGEFVRLVDL